MPIPPDLTLPRRTFLAAAALLPASRLLGCAAHRRPVDLVLAPNNLGLRPPAEGVEPGTWRAPDALEQAGLAAKVHPDRRLKLIRPRYSPEVRPGAGTRIFNAQALREFSLELAGEVRTSIGRGAFPVVVGGDCSILLGCLLALRRAGGRGLVHVDGHSDFFDDANYPPERPLHAAAGMDLALATGRGEPVLTEWPGIAGPLVEDADAVQIGERYEGFYAGLTATAIDLIPIRAVQAAGIPATAERTLRRLRDRALDRAWLHVDLDVLDEKTMRAVDSPGSPGLDYGELAELVRALLGSGRIAGMNVALYNPDLDPDGSQARGIVGCIGAMLAEPPR